jgi:selenocysteine lyase/cysteine desulfurase
MAAQGIAFLYCTEAMQAQIDPPAGWLHGPVDWENLDDYELRFHDDATRFRLGTTNNAGIAALNAALDVYGEAGPEQCEARVLRNARVLAEGLAERGFERHGTADPAHASGIVTVAPDASGIDPEAMFEHLMQHGVTGALRNRKLRLAPHWYNTTGEMERVLEVIDTFEPVTV